MLEKSQTSINRRQILKKLGGIFAGGIFVNLASSTDIMGPVIRPTYPDKNQDQVQATQQIISDQLNSFLPCGSREELWQYLEQHNYIYDYSWLSRLDSIPLKQSQKQQLNKLLQPIIQDDKNANQVVYYLLHHLIKQKVKELALTGIDDLNHKQLIQQLKETLPQGDQPYTHRYVDPAIIKLLDNSNTQSLLKLTYEEHKQPNKKIEVYDDVLDMPNNIYEVNGISKYSPNYAKELLEQQNIGLKSSDKGIQETGNNRSSNRTSLVEINSSSIDGIIALIKDIRTRRNYHQKEHITGGTELGIHREGPNGHEGGWKIDLEESLLILIILLEQGITQISNPSNPIIIGDYEYIFNYHGPDRHLDIKIREIASETLSEEMETQ